ncbi:MAG: hypothetical protein IKS00_08195 [Bacteroidales bacterium]|nr:hypothetical protein [Bacteroidales bacterium]
MKETILGNYLNFPRFPLDCESMDYIQENIKHLAIIAQIAGCDKLIIKGCTGSPRSAGYVYVRTGNDLLGEILYFPGGSGARCSIKTENINASANGETFSSAYTMRKLVSGTTGTWSWSEFSSLSDISNAALKALADTKADTTHNHDSAYAAIDHNHNDVYANIRHSHDYAATVHRHSIDEVQGLKSQLDGKSNIGHTHNYAAPSHSHSISDITNLQSALDDKAAANHNHDNVYANTTHDHDDEYYSKMQIDDKLAVTIDTHKAHLELYKQGRVVYVRFSAYSTPEGYYENSSISEQIPSEFRPIANYHGVGMVYFGADAPNQSNSSNLVPFRITIHGIISTMCYRNKATFEGSACYISAS